MSIAQKLGYISVLDSLKPVTNDDSMSTSQSDEKYRVVAPEAMHETFMSDSEEEGEFLKTFVYSISSIIHQLNTMHALEIPIFDLPFDWLPNTKKPNYFHFVN